MERWVLEGDTYSFLRSAPHTFNLQSREGPNRVEIFDITSIPTHHNAISETTCLCDIFGDDAESPSLSSSPASGTFIRREVDQPFPADDANDSSGSYHTANGSDLSDNTEVTYSTPSPKNISDFSSSETRKSHPPPVESTILSDSKDGLNPHECTPPATKVNNNDLSQQQKMSVCSASVNETEIQDLNSTPAISLTKESLNPESCSSEEKEPATFEPEEIITTPQHTSTSPSPVPESIDCESLAETQLEQNNVSSESKENIKCDSQQEETILLGEGMINNDFASEMSNASLKNCSPILEMSTSLANSDNFLPALLVHESRLNSPVIRKISSTSPSTVSSSPELLNLCSTQVENTSDSPDMEHTQGSSSASTLPTSDNMEIDSLIASSISTEKRSLVCSSTEGTEGLESPEIKETRSSPDQSAPAYSPELVMIYSPVCFSISPSPMNERTVSSTEPEASRSSSAVSKIDYSDICSSPEHLEPVIINSLMSYSISPSPTNDRGVYSTEPEATASSPCYQSEIYSSSDHSVTAHSPEAEIINLQMGYFISPSPTNERIAYSTEPDDLQFSPATTGNDYTATPTCSRDSTPAARSITFTSNGRENYLTPEPASPAPSLELRSVSCSPEIKTISYSVLTQNRKSPMMGDMISNNLPNRDIAQSPRLEASETSNSPFKNDASPSPSSMSFLSTSERRSRPSSVASDHPRDTELSPDLLSPGRQSQSPLVTLEKAEKQPLPIFCEGMNPLSPKPTDSGSPDDSADTEILKSGMSLLDEHMYCGQVLYQMQDLPSKPTGSGLSTVKEENNQEIITENTTSITVSGSTTPQSPSSVLIAMESVGKKQCQSEACDERNDILKNNYPSHEERFNQVPLAKGAMPEAISKDNSDEFDKEKERETREGDGEETMGESSYRGEQVELSFSARNRKGPVGHSPALSSRDPKSGIPACCYFESHPTTLQQQSQLRPLSLQQENKGGARRLQSTVHGKHSSAGISLPRENTGETSSMGSEFDEADNEVKWFTDLAFRSLSSPQVDYLDVYNSSHRSSTNVSQPSTIDSPGAVAWMTYADLRGSALHENDGSSFLPRDGLDPNKHFEIGSFECVDVALESKDESNRGKRTVPKRQIQLLRRNTDESNPVLNSPSMQRRSKDSLVRQHSTPVFVQEEFSKEVANSPQTDRKEALQNSVSLDDGSPKAQMASCIIKSVLSKKMLDTQKEEAKRSKPPTSGDKTKHPDINPNKFDDVPSNPEKRSLSSSQHSESTPSFDSFPAGEERISHRPLKKCAPPKVPPKPLLKPAFFNAMNAGNIKEETVPIVGFTQVDDKLLEKQRNKFEMKEGGDGYLGEMSNSDLANTSIRNTSPVVAIPEINMQNRVTKRDTKHQMMPERQKKLAGKSVFMSKTPEITLKPSSLKGKKTSSLKVSLSPDLELSREMSESLVMEKAAEDMTTQCTKVTETEEDDDNNKKSVVHKVRDVRKLVKNTYNLSFKASNLTSAGEDLVIKDKRQNPPQTPPLHIECKAISWKDKQAAGSKAIERHGEKQPVDILKIPQPWLGTETRRDADITEMTSEASLHKMEHKLADSHCTITDKLTEPENEHGKVHCDQSTKTPSKSPSKEREVCAMMILPENTSTTKTFDSTDSESNQKATNSSHSVSMLLKEKGMQADIGVCDVLTVGASATAKHVNKLEVPVQACLSESLPDPTALGNNPSRISQQSGNHKETLTEESSIKEQEKKKITATTTVTQTYLGTSGMPEVRSFSSSTKNNTTMNASKEIELPIQVRSISTDRIKTLVPPKPSYKQSFAEIRSVSSEPAKADIQASNAFKQQTRFSSASKKNESQSTALQKDQQSEPSSKDTKRLAVSAVSSYKPTSIPATTTSPITVQKSTTVTMAGLDQQRSSSFLESRSTNQQQSPSFSRDQSMRDSSFASSTSGPQDLGHTQSVTRASSNNRFHSDDYLFYASDDPPSYDERESFSPLRLSDMPSQRSCRYHPPTSKTSSCSCTPGSNSHQEHPQHTSQERVPASCPGAPPQAQVRPRQCRPDGLPVSSNTIPHASALIHPLHNPRACPNSQSYGEDQPSTSGLHADRRPAKHPSPQAAATAPYHEYSHSANMASLDPRPQLFNPQDLPQSFGHDYANEGPGGAGVLYPENAGGLSCGQSPRRVLLDPETGKYFYIEVPMQPLRKMLFDPELGQYVEVLIPQQTMSHSGLYPPAAPPYSSLHSPGLYAPPYLPYAVPSYPAIQGSAQQIRHPEPPSVPTTLHQTSIRYGSPASQMPKNEPKARSSLDHSYLEGMYYIPTGMNASPNSTPSDCYHKTTSNMPPSGGRRT